ncbi:leucyl aminopeptidase, partial [Micromonospora sp. NPDC049799]
MTSPSTTLSLVDSDPAELAVDAIVIGVHSQTGEQDATSGLAGTLLLASGAESIAAAFDGRLTETLALLGATGGPGEVIKLAAPAPAGGVEDPDRGLRHGHRPLPPVARPPLTP